MRKMKHGVILVITIFLIIQGCAGKNHIPGEDVRGRADRAFDELETEETVKEVFPPEQKKDSTIPSPESYNEPDDTVHFTKGQRPDWVDGHSKQYPSAQYLTGVGYGPDRKSAEDKARAEIAKIFVSKIDSQTRSFQEYLQSTSHGRSTTKETFSIDELTKVSTQQVLSGVRIYQVYREKGDGGTFYALAALVRNQSATIIGDKIQELDQEIKGLLMKSQQEKDTLAKIRYLKQSARKHILRQAYDVELRIIRPSGKGISPSIRFSEIRTQLESILMKDFFIGISITGHRAQEIKDGLIEGLNQEGFSTSEKLDQVNIMVRGTVHIKALDRGTPEWKYVRWRAHFDVVRKAEEAVFGSVNKIGRQGHLSMQQAEDKAIQEINNIMTTEIAREIRRYILSQ